MQLGHHLKTGLMDCSLVLRPRSPRGEGSGDICAVCWLCKVSNSVTLLQCYVIHHNIYMRANMYIAMQQDTKIEEPKFARTGLLSLHNQENAQMSPDPFPYERVGSGYETTWTEANIAW